MLKSIGVVVGSYVLSMVLVFSTDPLLSRIFPGQFESGHVPGQTPLMASTAFFVVISILCAFVCARFAPGSASKHVLWFLVLGEVMGIAFTVPNWSKPGWPHWYFLSWLLTWPVSCYIGLLLGRSRPTKATAATV